MVVKKLIHPFAFIASVLCYCDDNVIVIGWYCNWGVFLWLEGL